jgi:hypothetical protein
LAEVAIQAQELAAAAREHQALHRLVLAEVALVVSQRLLQAAFQVCQGLGQYFR